MGRQARGSEPRELPPAKTYGAVICGIYELGHKPTPPSWGTGPQHQFLFQYSLHSRKTGQVIRDAKGEPLTILEFVNFYLGKASKPSPLLETFSAVNGGVVYTQQQIDRSGPIFDVEKLLDGRLQVSVAHKPNDSGVVKARVDSRLPIDPEDTPPEPALDSQYFEIPAKWDGTIPEGIPSYIAKFIRESNEWRAATQGGKAPDEDESPRNGGSRAPDRNPPFQPTRAASPNDPREDDLEDRF